MDLKFKHFGKQIILIILLFINPFIGFNQDTIKSIDLNEISISDSSNNNNFNSKSSGSHINKAMIEKIESNSIGDITKFITGAVLKDYGGIGGMKTVSVRGLGSQNTGIVYDGINISNQSSGQVDLSKFSTNNIESINLANAQGFSLLQTARNLSSASVMYINSISPVFDSAQRFKLSTSVKYGSFNYFNYGLNTAFKLSEKWILSTDIDLVNTQGNYPYTLKYGSSSKDSTSKEYRENADYFGFRGEVNLFGKLRKGDIKLKAYYFNSNSGLPGSTSLYYLQSSQRLWDETFFTQGVYTYNINRNLTYRNHSKYQYSMTHYLDPDFQNSQGKKEDKYFQNEFYTNNVLMYRWNKNLYSSITNDIIFNAMNSQSSFNILADRISSLSAIVTSYNNNKLLITGNILHNYAIDNAELFNTNNSFSHFSPFLSIGYTFFKSLTLSFFYKDVFRLPTFNDLYFNIVSAPKLKPENSNQFNFHIEYEKDLGFSPSFFVNFSLDAYKNLVKDKIIAVPSKNLFVWSVVNYGEVDIKGMDFQASIRTYLKYSLDVSLRATYSIQEALDISNKTTNSDYKYNQIPYTPKHSGSLLLNIIHPIAELTYTISFVGKRYSMIENIDRNILKPYQDHGISISRSWEFKKYRLNTGLSCLNILGKQYEVVRNYPMPKTQFRINLKLNLK